MALALHTLVPTPLKMRRLQELRAGDQVFDWKGRPTEVLSVGEVKRLAPVYAVRTSDGGVFLADGDQAWDVHVSSMPSRHSIVSTREVALRAPRTAVPVVAPRLCGMGADDDWHKRPRIWATPAGRADVLGIRVAATNGLYLLGATSLPTHHGLECHFPSA